MERKIKISLGQMNLMLMAVEHGFRQHEKGNNLDAAWASLYEMYEVDPGRHPDPFVDAAERVALGLP